MSIDPIIGVSPLGFPWPTKDPFLVCVHHVDLYPQGNDRLGARNLLRARCEHRVDGRHLVRMDRQLAGEAVARGKARLLAQALAVAQEEPAPETRSRSGIEFTAIDTDANGSLSRDENSFAGYAVRYAPTAMKPA